LILLRKGERGTMLQTKVYSINVIKDEARHLVCQGVVGCHQPIYTLCQYIPARDWEGVECELEDNDFLLRDRIIDLIGYEEWRED
jgi:hypothetical protein